MEISEKELQKLEQLAIYDNNGTLINDVGNEILDYYEENIRKILSPLRDYSNFQLFRDLEKKGLEIEFKGSIAKILEDFIVEKVKKPRRDSPGRELYLHFFEKAFDEGKLKFKAYEDIFSKNSFLKKDREKGYKIAILARSQISIIQKIAKTQNFDYLIDYYYSTIPYKGEKSKDFYIDFFFDLLKDGKVIRKIYENEFETVSEMFHAGFEVAKKLKLKNLPYEAIWVNRTEENKKPEIKDLKKLYKEKKREPGFTKYFNEIFSIAKQLNL